MKVLVVGVAAVLAAAGFVPELGVGSASTGLAVLEPARPKQPTAYRLPEGALHVATSAQLRAALRRRAGRDIVLGAGVYESREPFSNRFGHRLYAAELGRAILRAGMSVGANGGGEGALLRGLVFDLRDPSRTLNGAAIEVWGSATGARVLDTTLRGHRAVSAGIVARQPTGFRARRVVARDFTGYGVLVDANELGQPTVGRFVLEDLDVANVARPERGSSRGTAEACVWIGNTGVARRLRLRNCGWMGLWTGTSTRGALIEHVDVDRTPTGVYIEHFTRSSTFQSIYVRSNVRVGMAAEWASPEWGGLPASVDNVIRRSTFESSLCGVYLDEGTTRTTVRQSVFRGQRWAAIGNYKGNGNTFAGNDYSGIDRAAVPVSREHLSAAGG